ncbi:uncharacterized protein BDR25DRAFT_331549 [Lindgomyces ingoldianus]|uniref:Uncharacterized protein n=1 Tax=Lindgomyces ingoldianus TaxID=673940 RepID=A0ACB6R902_9PLEO|nr:uncharacterized protein BDR25DRAFT_331549 [Lindgomyces ingoldianus]KAF2475804.1 hypothetical protein BDR25DRAFT_331549 [Lindgomyces ingoldianus]
MATSIFHRKRDLVYLVFFLIHLPVMLAFDLTSFYPTSIKPAWMPQVRAWYYNTYGDRFFSEPPSWFTLYTLLELTYHLPLTLWAIPALLRNDPRIPLHLLIFGLQTTITTLTCMAEMLSWEELNEKQRGVQGLGGMYGGYLGLGWRMWKENSSWVMAGRRANFSIGVFMAVDCYARLDQLLSKTKGIEPVTKKEL